MIEYIYPSDEDMKFKLMEFVYKNTDSFILNTFGYLWEERKWWNKFPIQVYKINDKIVGLHAFSIGTKEDNVFKTYYIITDKEYRGKGIAKQLILCSLDYYESNTCTTYYVNSEENSDGIPFFKKMFDNQFVKQKNQFGTDDYIFKAPIKTILNKCGIKS